MLLEQKEVKEIVASLEFLISVDRIGITYGATSHNIQTF